MHESNTSKYSPTIAIIFASVARHKKQGWNERNNNMMKQNLVNTTGVLIYVIEVPL